MDLGEISSEGLDWLYLAQDGDKYEHDNETSGCIKCGEFLYWPRTC
jgi:hypothetical protein